MVPNQNTAGAILEHGEPLAALALGATAAGEPLLLTAGGTTLKAWEHWQRQRELSHKHTHAAPGIWVGLSADANAQGLCAAQAHAAHLFRLGPGFRAGSVLRPPAHSIVSLWPAWQTDSGVWKRGMGEERGRGVRKRVCR